MNTVISKDKKTLDELLAPMSPELFLNKHWQHRPCVTGHAGETQLTRLISIEDLEGLIACTSARRVNDGLRIVRSCGSELETRQVPLDRSGIPDLFALYRLYYDGWTLIVNSVHRRWPPIARFAANLEEELGHAIGINLYFTPPNSQGFLPHVDGHDVFVLQIRGEKRWRVFTETKKLPLEDWHVQIAEADTVEATLVTRLMPGKVLYIPRGWTHRALTDDASSIHLTIGIRVRVWLELVNEAIALAAERDVRLRETLPGGDWRDGKLRGELQTHLGVLMKDVASFASDDEVLARHLRKASTTSSRPLTGHFCAIESVGSLTLKSIVERRPGLRCAVDASSDGASIEFAGHRITGPEEIEPALRFVAEHRRFILRELPDFLSDSSKLVLGRRLVREGLLARAN